SRRRTQAARVLTFMAAVSILLALIGLPPALPVLASCGGTTFVSNTEELNDAIDDFNNQVNPCDFKIELSSDITLTNDIDEIGNSNAGLSLLIDGAGHTLDADYHETFAIYNTGPVTFEDITIERSGEDGIFGVASTIIILRSTIQISDSGGVA